MFRVNDVKISDNFKLWEFESKDTKEVIIDPELIWRLQDLRNLLNTPVVVKSGYRTPEHNKAEGGAANSYHLRGQAADICVPGVSLELIFHAAYFVGFRGIITYENANFTHIDVRSEKYMNAPYDWQVEARADNKFKAEIYAARRRILKNSRTRRAESSG